MPYNRRRRAKERMLERGRKDMKKEFIIRLTLDTETAKVVALDVTEGLIFRTEYVLEGVDNPISIGAALYNIGDALTEHIG